MPTAEATAPESRSFEADVAKLLQLMVHSVYSDRDVFLRELISNAADACERLRFEAIADPALLGDDSKPRITLLMDDSWLSSVAFVVSAVVEAFPALSVADTETLAFREFRVPAVIV